MASGDVVLHQLGPASGPGTNYALADTKSGGSTPGEIYPVWRFPDTDSNYLDVPCQLIGYDGGGLTLSIKWSADDATGNSTWGAALRTVSNDVGAVTAAHTYVFNSNSATAPTVADELDYADITFTDGADMDSPADNDFVVLRIRRVPLQASDTLATNAYLWGFIGTET